MRVNQLKRLEVDDWTRRLEADDIDSFDYTPWQPPGLPPGELTEHTVYLTQAGEDLVTELRGETGHDPYARPAPPESVQRICPAKVVSAFSGPADESFPAGAQLLTPVQHGSVRRLYVIEETVRVALGLGEDNVAAEQAVPGADNLGKLRRAQDAGYPQRHLFVWVDDNRFGAQFTLASADPYVDARLGSLQIPGAVTDVWVAARNFLGPRDGRGMVIWHATHGEDPQSGLVWEKLTEPPNDV